MSTILGNGSTLYHLTMPPTHRPSDNTWLSMYHQAGPGTWHIPVAVTIDTAPREWTYQWVQVVAVPTTEPTAAPRPTPEPSLLWVVGIALVLLWLTHKRV